MSNDKAVGPSVEGNGPGEVEIGVVQVGCPATIRDEVRRGVGEHRVVEEAADRISADAAVVVECARIERRVGGSQAGSLREGSVLRRSWLVFPDLSGDK